MPLERPSQTSRFDRFDVGRSLATGGDSQSWECPEPSHPSVATSEPFGENAPMNQSTRIVGTLIAAFVTAAGCASPWEKNFVANPDLAGQKFAATTAVELRTIPFERYQRYVENEHKRRVESTTAPQDLPREEQLAAKDRLLEALQLRERGDDAEVLGWSEFVADEPLRADSPKLADFGKKVGADYVIVASNYAGQVTRTEERPVTTYSQGFTTFTRGRGRRGAVSNSYSDQTTTWVPMLVTTDEYFYEAVYVRKRRAAE